MSTSNGRDGSRRQGSSAGQATVEYVALSAVMAVAGVAFSLGAISLLQRFVRYVAGAVHTIAP